MKEYTNCKTCIHNYEPKPNTCSCGRPGRYRKEFKSVQCDSCYCDLLLIKILKEGLSNVV